VLLAAGTAGVLDEFGEVCPLEKVGGIVTKSITREPREGNPTWRILESRAGLLNAIGLANPGIERFLADHAPRAGSVPTTVIASIAGNTVEDYVAVAAALDAWAAAEGGGPAPIPAVEINVSCPNVHTGLEFGAAAPVLIELLSEVRPVLRRAKMFVKLSPATQNITAVARAAIDSGADALTLGNTIPAMEIDVESRRPRLANVTGGLSGPALHPIGLRIVHTVYTGVARDANVPVIGVGGVMTWRDAAAYILAGATAVQMGTMLFADPRAPLKVAAGLARWARRQGVDRLADLVGQVKLDRMHD
jgi:dihydroorotate dehydrogenase (NAD+) catalytic subunit